MTGVSEKKADDFGQVPVGVSGKVAPLTPEACNLTDFEFMPLSVTRLFKSKAWLKCKRKPELAFYMINLWGAAWHEVPAASIEDDDEVLADKAMCHDPALWLEIKADVLRGFVKCTDGRLYHEVIAVKALEAWLEKLAQRLSSGAGNAARWRTVFDSTQINLEYLDARARLMFLDPMNKSFSRKRTATAVAPEAPVEKPKRGRKPKAVNNPGTTPVSGPDPDGIARDSEETGTVKGQGSNKDADAPEGSVPPKVPKIVMANRNLPLPDWMPKDQWRDFEETRWAKNSRAPYTLRAQQGLIKKLSDLRDEGQDPVTVLEASVRNGWTDLFAVKGAVVNKARSALSAAGRNTLANAKGAEERIFGVQGADHATH